MNETVISVAPDDAVGEAVETMEAEAYSQLPVLQSSVPVGSISQHDVIQAGEDVSDYPVSEVMSESFPTVSENATVNETRNLLEHYKAVMVTQGGATVGIITEADIAAQFS